MNKKGFAPLLILVVVAMTMLVALVGTWWIFQSMQTSSIQQKKLNPNSATAKISDISWPNGSFKIFYMNAYKENDKYFMGLFSQYTDGRQRKLIYPVPQTGSNIFFDYYLIDSTQEIIVLRRNEIVLLQADGQNSQTIFQTPQDNQIAQARISPDEQKLIVWVFIAEDTPYDIYLIDLAKKSASKLSIVKERLNYDRILNILWNKNSNEIILYTHTKILPTDIATPYFHYATYNISSEEVKILAKQQSCPGDNCKPLSNFIDSREVYEPEPDLGPLFSRSVSPDKEKLAKIKEGNVMVNDIVLMQWHNYNIKFNAGYGDPKWLPDNNHLIVTGKPELFESHDIRIIEIDSKKVARLDEGHNVKWFGEQLNIPGRLEFLLSDFWPGLVEPTTE